MSAVGTTWLATLVGIGGIGGLAFGADTIGQLRRLHKLRSSHDAKKATPASTGNETTIIDDQDRYPGRKLKRALLWILLASLLFLIKVTMIIVGFVTYSSKPYYGICIFDSKDCREGRRQKHEWSLQVGRLSYANAFFTITTKVMLFVVLITMKRLLLPAKATPTRTKLSRLSDVGQVVTLLALGLASWFISMSRRRQAGYTITVSGVDTDIQDVGFFQADAAFSNGIYLWAAFACWAALMSVPVIASLLRKISHSRKAGLPETEIHIVVVFTKWMVPVLLLAVSFFVASVFLIIFRKDLSLSATAAPIALEGISSVYGDLVIYIVSLWAVKRLIGLWQEKRGQQQLAVSVTQV